MSGKFVLKRGTSGKYRFNLLASNGKVIATSEPYESKSAALHGIESVRRNASGAAFDDQTEKPSSGSKKSTRGHETSGGDVGRALKRDWEQTKSDLPGLEGRDLNQDLGDTLKQATGEESAPPLSKPTRAG